MNNDLIKSLFQWGLTLSLIAMPFIIWFLVVDFVIVYALTAIKKGKPLSKVLSILFKVFAFFNFILVLFWLFLFYTIPHPSLSTILTFFLPLTTGIVYFTLSYGLSKEKRWAWWCSLSMLSVVLIFTLTEFLLTASNLSFLISFPLSSILPVFTLILLIKAKKKFLEKPKEKVSQLIRDYRFLIATIGIIFIIFINGILVYSGY